MPESAGNQYWAAVDPAAPNNAHSYALDLVGFSKRVLELGPAAGHVTRALVQRGCEVVGIERDPDAAAALEDIAECILGDLCDPTVIAKAAETQLFDVVLAGDVLEHLPNPHATLAACAGALVPGGYVVLSLPNIAHADVALSLLAGRFVYRDTGLMDRTHLRFFTRESVEELLEHAGFTLLEVRRVIRPVFETELSLDPKDFGAELVATALLHPEAETYQFVMRAVRHDGDSEVRRLASRCVEAEERARQDRIARLSALAEIEVLSETIAALRAQLVASHQRVEHWQQESARHAAHAEALLTTKTMRTTAPFRAVYGAIRRARP